MFYDTFPKKKKDTIKSSLLFPNKKLLNLWIMFLMRIIVIPWCRWQIS